MRLETVEWHGQILRVSFGDGYGAKANVGHASGLHKWSMRSGGVWPDFTEWGLTIGGLARFEYYWEFFKAHTTGTTDIFIIEFRGKKYHASFVDDAISMDKIKRMLLYEGSVEIQQRRVSGESYGTDGSILDEEAPSVPTGLTLELL